MKKVLFIASHRPGRAPGQRFRFEQYFDYLQQHGFQCELSCLMDEQDDKVFYQSGNILRKFAILRKGYNIRKADLRRIGNYDLVFVFREALMTRSMKFEKAFKASGVKMIFDFDDAIWLQNVSDANKRFAFAKNPEKTSRLISMADHVIAGNQYLADYAARFNSTVSVIPTTIDTDEYTARPPQGREKITIGWSGSITTIRHFEYAVPALRRIVARFGDRVRIKVIGDANYRNEELGVQGVAWNRQSEIADLSEIDIGIMPLPNDEWARGKCGLKGLQYMALEIPTIMSPVGVNTGIIADGVNGFLASSDEDWYEKLAMLIENPSMRQKLGMEGRKTVEAHYSVKANREKYLRLFTDLTAAGH